MNLLAAPERLRAVDALGDLDALVGIPVFDTLAALAAQVVHAPTGRVVIVGAEREVCIGAKGLVGPTAIAQGTSLDQFLCRHVVDNVAPLVLNDMGSHPLVHEYARSRDLDYGAYLGVRLHGANGEPLGALCVASPAPRAWTPAQVESVLEIATVVSSELNHRAVANALAAREARDHATVLTKVLENVPLMVALLNSDGTIEWVSQQWERVLGWDVDALKAAPDILAVMYPDEAERAAALSYMQSDVAEWRLFAPQAKDGTPIPSTWRNVRLPDGGFVGFGRDERAQAALAAEREVAAEALRVSEERYALAARATSSVVWELDVTSQQATRVSGSPTIFGHVLDSADAQLAWWSDNLHPDERQAVLDSFAGTVQSPTAVEWRSKYRFRRGDGSWAHVAARAFVVRDALGAPIRVIGALDDISAEVELEERVRQTQKMEAVGQLAGGVAHDFNNLLAVISANVELALGDLPREETLDNARESINEVQRTAERATSLVRQLLTFSRRRPVHVAPTDLREALQSAERMLRQVIGEEIHLDMEVPERLAAVRVDAGQLEQIVLNLVLNGRDAILGASDGATATGGVISILVELVDAALVEALMQHRMSDGGTDRLPGDRPFVCLTVRDSGHGMDADTVAKAFEPFFTTKPFGQGTGLGLATVYGIVRQAGGTITINSALGAGTTVAVYLPSAPLDVPAERSTQVAAPSLEGRTILLVEDESAVRIAARRLLERHGIEVLEARHGLDALEVFRGGNAHIDAVLTDVRMPECGGEQLAVALRAEDPTLPVVFMSGYGETAARPFGLESAVFVDKPFSSATLLAALQEVLKGVPPRVQRYRRPDSDSST